AKLYNACRRSAKQWWERMFHSKRRSMTVLGAAASILHLTISAAMITVQIGARSHSGRSPSPRHFRQGVCILRAKSALVDAH
ncbi:hypothetical protein LB579_26660, partial [Mesorhizobium sp. BR1-1-7]|uniref:hypothetical protein n=1 Tax=Mesorhizobium sp. BR1-1-7 TaxID=2876647 RepID=UPI001CCE0BB7